MKTLLSALALTLLSWTGLHATDGLSKTQMHFLDQYCAECHDADVKKAGLDLTSLKLDLQSADNRAM
jgi:cytochrome c551/c552